MRSRRSLTLVPAALLALASIASFAHADIPPLIVPPDQTLEAHDATGAPLTFEVTAADAGAALDATCDHPAGGSGHGTFELTETFALGATLVTCKTEVAGTDVTGSFTVTVRDTTPPVLVVPAPITIDAASTAGVAATAPAAAAFLAAPTVLDLVDPAPTISNNAPAVFPVGTTNVLFVARDGSGNLAAGQSSLTVVAPPETPPPPPLPPPPGNKPAADVSDLKAQAASRVVSLTWTLPTDGFDHVVVLRTNLTRRGQETTVYEGSGSSYRDSGLNYGQRSP